VNIDWTWDPNGRRWREDRSENADGRNIFPYSDGRIQNDGAKVWGYIRKHINIMTKQTGSGLAVAG